MRDLEGKVAVVTGAASGIGRACAEAFAAEGMKVVLADVEEGPLAAAASALEDGGASVAAVPTDVRTYAAVEALRDAALSSFGAVHLVHNNAGVGAGGPIWTISESDWEWTLGVNLWGVVHGVRAFVPQFIEQGDGHVVNTASLAGLLSGPMMGPYTVSKQGVVAISETLLKDLQLAGAQGVGVSVLCPGFVQTRIHEADRNRPSGPGNTEMGPGGFSFLKEGVESGMPPAQVAQVVVDGVRNDRFYLFTHPEMRSMVEARFAEILSA